MAFVGASSAVAESTALCKVDPGKGAHEACPPGNLVAHVHESTLDSVPAHILSSLGSHLCSVLFLGNVISANNLGNPLEISGSFTYTNCKTTLGTECIVTETSASSIIKVLKLGHELADVTYSGEVNLHCGSLINCTYDGVGQLGHALGPLLASEENGEIRFEEQALNKTGGTFCPKTAKLDLLMTPMLEKTYITE